MCFLHRWGSWHEKNLNHYPYIIPKREFRECENCRKEEERDLPSLEKRIFLVYKDGVSEKGIESALKNLMQSYGKMRYDFVARNLVKEAIEGRK